MSKIRCFAKQDIKVVTSFIKKGEEVRIGKIFPTTNRFMVICREDNLHANIELDKYNELIEDRLVED